MRLLFGSVLDKGDLWPLGWPRLGTHGMTVTVPRPADSSLKRVTLISEIISTPGQDLGVGTGKEAEGGHRRRLIIF